MSGLSFSHPNTDVGGLVVSVNPDSVQWAYNLNFQTYPTYGGEVVQILSVYIDDIIIKGQLTSQEEMEDIYNYFARYMVVASQGSGFSKGPTASYNQQYMTMVYANRDWVFTIQPLSAPGFWKGTEVVAPQWGIAAHVVDESGDGISKIKEMIKTHATGQITDVDNPANVYSGTFSIEGAISPSPSSNDPNKNPFQTFLPTDQKATLDQISKSADYFNTLIPSYLKSDFSSLWDGVGSSPAFGDYGGKSQGTTTQAIPKSQTKPKK